MKILVTIDLEPRHHDLIRSAVDGVEILEAHSVEDAERLIPEADVLIGGFSPNLYRRAKRLRWVQSWGAGVDGVLFKEFVESEIALTSGLRTSTMLTMMSNCPERNAVPMMILVNIGIDRTIPIPMRTRKLFRVQGLYTEYVMIIPLQSAT